MKYLDKTDWTKTNLDSVTTIIGDGLHGTPKYNEAGKYYFINGRNLQGKILIDDKTKRVDETEYRKYKKKLNNRTIFLSINGTIGNIAEYNEQKIILGKSVCYLNVNDDVNKKFIKYELMTPQFKNYSDNYSSGTTIKNLGLKEIREYEFDLPPYEEQEKISKVLNILDNKIENNNAIISNLEEQAQAIFKSWFIDFEPFQGGNFVDSELGKIPEGWEVGKLGNSSLGKLLKSGISNFKNKKVYLATADVTDSKIINYDTKITFDERPSRANMQPIKNSLWFAKMKNSRKLIYVGENNDFLVNKVVFSTGFAGINASELGINYLWTYLLTEDFNAKKDLYSNGTTMQAINNTNINKIKIVIPEKNVLKAFNDLVKPMYELISNYEHQNIKLSNIRDTLLPKLMSGELRVGQDDIEDIESQI